MTPDAGSSSKVSKNRGFMAIPEVGDQVMVNFQHNHPDRPFVMGGLFHGKVGGGGGSGNNIKSLSSKSGHIIELNDGGGMMIRDKNGNHVTLSGDGDITTQVSNDNTENIGHNHTTNVKTKTTINVGKGQSVLMMDDTGAISVESIKEIKFKTGSSSIMMDKDGNITIKGINITVEGTTTKIIGSSLAEIGKKGANAGMKIDGDVTIKGGKIIEN